MKALSQEEIDAWAARLVHIFKNGQSWDVTHELEKSYVRGVVEGIAADIFTDKFQSGINEAYNSGFNEAYNSGFNAGFKSAISSSRENVDPPIDGPNVN
jgi:hypothetical protein